MNVSAGVLAATLLAAPCIPVCAQEKLSALVTQVMSADYRGDRAALARLDAILAGLDGKTLPEYREYWRGFALWRRALNGFNEAPTPTDLADDLEKAIVHFRRSLDLRPGWIEPRIVLVGCGASLLYLAGKDEARLQALRAEFVPMLQGIQKDGPENARAWLIGGMEFGGAASLWRQFRKGDRDPHPGTHCRLERNVVAASAAFLGAGVGRSGEPHESRLRPFARRDAEQGRRARLCSGRPDGGPGMALRARHSSPPDPEAAGRAPLTAPR